MKTFIKQIGMTSCCIMMFISCCGKPTNNLKLWYNAPAEKWGEALPVGNGRLGAMVFGNPTQERIQLNEETVWAGQPNNNINPDALAAIPKIRKLMFEGKFKEAQDLANERVMPKTNHGMSYQPVGDLNLSFSGHTNPEQYYRELDLSSAITTTRYMIDGVEYVRETFATFPGQVIVVRLTASQKGKINFSAWLSSPQKSETRVQDDELILKGISGNQEGLEGKVQFTTEVKVVPEKGQLSADGDKLTVTDANAATLYISIASNFVNYHDISGNPDERSKSYLQSALQKSYKDLRSAHIAFYKNYFDRVQLDLGVTDSIKKPTDI
ncbi:hypothetical protein EZS27_036612, partial [termite gut metagenome]